MNYSHFVGLDVGKKTFDASLMSADEKELSHKSFDNTPTGIQSLLDWIAGYHLSLSKLLFCAETWEVMSQSYLFPVSPWDFPWLWFAR